jgi:ABC-type Fe3+-hydroxamate transport system substrate-binding protein
VAAEEAEQMGVSEDAEAADSAMTYFTVLLQDKMGSLFECQRLNVYWETAQDHVTIHKTSPEHALILNAGCYDVSARLLPENLLVDDGWVARKNPGVIVKIVGGGVLDSERSAKAMADSLRSREGWAAIDAIQNRRILLLSEDLLQAPYLQTAAMVMIAKTANPDLFADVDLDHMLQMLMEEATGTLPTAVYYYKED